MGVSGCGKSTLAHALALALGWPMIEGDQFHPASNVAKMAAGTPLTDADRAPWLASLNTAMRQLPHAVLSCSALKSAYREVLCQQLPNAALVHAHGSYDELLARMVKRQASEGHFMPASLLRSQFDALELPSPAECCITVSTELATPLQVAQVLAALKP